MHPLHVESVAWVAERKDVLSTFFGLLALWAYFKYARDSSVKNYLLVLCLFVSRTDGETNAGEPPMSSSCFLIFGLFGDGNFGELMIKKPLRSNRKSTNHILLEKFPLVIYCSDLQHHRVCFAKRRKELSLIAKRFRSQVA